MPIPTLTSTRAMASELASSAPAPAMPTSHRVWVCFMYGYPKEWADKPVHASHCDAARTLRREAAWQGGVRLERRVSQGLTAFLALPSL